MAAQIPTLSVNTYYKLGTKTFWLSLSEKLSVSIGFFILGAALAVSLRLSIVPEEFKPFVAMGALVLFCVFLISLIIGIVVAWFVYTNHLFCLDDDAFKIKRGIFTKVETAFPYRQIQNVEIERRLLFQLLGLSKIMIITAGHDNPRTIRNEAEGLLPMVDKEIAIALQDELLRRSDVQRTVVTK